MYIGSLNERTALTANDSLYIEFYALKLMSAPRGHYVYVCVPCVTQGV